ncbi:MAG: MBL fold metallo-hydrolase [Bdellovibrionaceae bacterium]|nr:MBL fold metallo-hydrolase [Pseudobdellovibrionaceae bacterium]
MRLGFLGATGTVTGSKYLVTHREQNILIDCGLFQGLKELRLQNWDQFPLNPKSIDTIVLTHAHIDHSGYIPRLIKKGFKGKIFCTHATFALCKILLVDAGHLQEEEAEWLNRKKFSKHSPALPLFTQKEAEIALEQFIPKNFDESFEVTEGIRATFKYAGHILGAASVIIEVEKIKIAFSGDIGRSNDPILYPPVKIPKVDFLVVESTYGNRQHESTDPMKDLEIVINEGLEKNGVILIPAFAVGRAQTLMYYLATLKKLGRIPHVPMYLNSPMATNVTDLFHQFKTLHKLSPGQCQEMGDAVKYVKTVEESKALNEKKGPMIIISASGMATGGRIVHHLKAFVSNPTTTVVLAGFQAAGTRGRALQDGAKEIKIHREMIPVNASIRILKNISAHADYTEIIDWLARSEINPRKVFITHGEVEAANAMKVHLIERFKWSCEVPQQNQEFLLG